MDKVIHLHFLHTVLVPMRRMDYNSQLHYGTIAGDSNSEKVFGEEKLNNWS
jgi:hypothetical protein